ncbi:MAG: molybdopterin-dependent oxidoreductase [Campylobacterota bacterium]|nr:molybdopterin-dependent oxidoreductase [Campylobacterota bacterium]
MIQSACGLDCYDACSIVSEDDKLRGGEDSLTNGALCSILNKHMSEANRITTPIIDGKEVSMEEALDVVAKVLDQDALLYRGSGNMGVMQEMTNLLFKELNATIANGSLCDGAGAAGIQEGRGGANRVLTPEHIGKAEVVVIWGRNIDVTNAHLMPYLEGKKLVVIDPVATSIAKRADIHLQIRPRSDLYLALLLSRFVMMQDMQDDCDIADPEDLYDFSRNFRIKLLMKHIGVSADDIGQVVALLAHEKVVHLVGVGVQKYSIGDGVLRAIDSLAVLLGHYGKEGCGVSYLGNSRLGFDNPFSVKTKNVSRVDAPFSQFKSVLIQGANPAHSMPNSNKVIKELEGVEDLIYFGTYHNETSKMARIIIPALTFLEKYDVRLSYSDYTIKAMNPVVENSQGISEYAFTEAMFERLGFEGLKSESEYINHYLNQAIDGLSPEAENMLEFDEFEFIEEVDDEFENIKNLTNIKRGKKVVAEDNYWLLTPKAKHSINSQFKRSDAIEIHSSLGYVEGESISITSEYGSLSGVVKINDDIRQDCIVIRANVTGVNALTPPIVSNEGNSACYQEVKVEITK